MWCIKNWLGYYFYNIPNNTCIWTPYREEAMTFRYRHQAEREKNKINKGYGRPEGHVEQY